MLSIAYHEEQEGKAIRFNTRASVQKERKKVTKLLWSRVAVSDIFFMFSVPDVEDVLLRIFTTKSVEDAFVSIKEHIKTIADQKNLLSDKTTEHAILPFSVSVPHIRQKQSKYVQNLLLSEGMSTEEVEKLILTLSVFSDGFAEMMNHVREQSSKPQEAVSNVLKIYVTLLEECQTVGDGEITDEKDSAFFAMDIQKIEKVHRKHVQEQELMFAKQEHILSQEEKAMKQEIGLISELLSKATRALENGKKVDTSINGDLIIQKNALDRLEANVFQLKESLQNWNQRISDITLEREKKADYCSLMTSKLQRLKSESQKVQKIVKTRTDEIIQLSEKQKEFYHLSNTVAEEKKSYEKQLDACQNEVSFFFQFIFS